MAAMAQKAPALWRGPQCYCGAIDSAGLQVIYHLAMDETGDIIDGLSTDWSRPPRLPEGPNDFLSLNACRASDAHIDDLITELLLNPELDHRLYQKSVQVLRLQFWLGFWHFAYPHDRELASAESACGMLINHLGDNHDRDSAERAYRRGRHYVGDWAGPNWRPGSEC